VFECTTESQRGQGNCSGNGRRSTAGAADRADGLEAAVGSLVVDISPAPDPRCAAVLLHPHPDFGGNRFHPFIAGLYDRLPKVGVTAVRFDFSSSDPAVARDETLDALDTASSEEMPVVLVGYSFGAGVAASVNDDRLIGWYLLAPQTEWLVQAAISEDPRPKAIVVPEFDQFSPPPAVDKVVSDWQATTMTTVPGTDHFLGAVAPLVDQTVEWVVVLRER
jgi:alpha/beta superfamily hydrolase